MADPSMLPRSGRVVPVILKDGRQLEGELLVMTGRYAIGDVVFEAWEIETLEDVTSGGSVRRVILRGVTGRDSAVRFASVRQLSV